MKKGALQSERKQRKMLSETREQTTREEMVMEKVEAILEAEVSVVEYEEVAVAIKAEPPVIEKDEEPEVEESAVPEKDVVPSVKEAKEKKPAIGEIIMTVV